MLFNYFIYLAMFFSALLPHGLNCSVKCNSINISVPLGSEVLLPCTLFKSNKTETAKWSHNSSLLVIKDNGTVNFEDPRDGRVTVFPFLFRRGNFTILIHQLQDSDLGAYCCQLSHECQRVKLNLSKSLAFPWYYIAIGLGGLILLVVVCSLTYEFRGKCTQIKQNSYYVNSKTNVGNKELKTEEPNQNANNNESEGAYEEMESSDRGGDYVNMQEEELEVQENQEDIYVNTARVSDSESEDTGEHRASKDASNFPSHHTRTTVYENEQHDPNRVSCDRTKPPIRAFKKIPILNHQTDSGVPYYANKLDNQKSSTDDQGSNEQYQIRNPLYADRTATSGK